MRYPILDGLRGYFLVFMMVVHLNDFLHTTIGRLNHHLIGYVQDAQGFIFISGLVVSLVYGGKLVKQSAEAMDTAIWTRWRTIYKHQAALIILFLIAAMMLDRRLDITFLQPYADQPVIFTLASLALVTCSENMGILPLYLYFIAVTPLLLRLFYKGYVIPVAFASLLVWLFSQLMLTNYLSGALTDALVPYNVSLKFAIGFNPFAWQIIYVMGLYIGFRLATVPIDYQFLKGPQWRAMFYVAVATVLGLFVIRTIIFYNLISPTFSETFMAKFPRGDFSTLHLIAFLIDFYIIAWLFLAAPAAQSVPLQRAGVFMHWAFTRRPLVFLGQHSLQVFAWHIVVYYIVDIIAGDRPMGQLWGSVAIILSVASLYIPAYVHARYTKFSKRRVKKLQEAAA